MKTLLGGLVALAVSTSASASEILAPPVKPDANVSGYVSVAAPLVALANVRVIDGTGAPPVADQTVLIESGKIRAIQPATAPVPSGAKVIDLAGHTVIPGLVGMHDHLFYAQRPNLDAEGHADVPRVVTPQMNFSAPRLYLAAGVTTLRTTGSVEPQADLALKKSIDAGSLPGPHLDVTGPYLEGPPAVALEFAELKDADDARRTVAFWADKGATSFKAYMHITRAELKAAIDEAHRRGLKVTGHLCSVTYPEAVALGIDNLEHGFYVNTQLDPGKTPDVCPSTIGESTLAAMTPESAEAKALIKLLVDHHVALTSTLPVFEQSVPGHAPLQARVMATMSPSAREAYLYNRNVTNTPRPASAKVPPNVARAASDFQNEMALERAFVAAGGLLLAGPDPSGNGGVLPGFGDQREVELLVEAGFTPPEAIKIATWNGAVFLRLQDKIGSIAPGKDADLVVVDGDPSTAIADIEKVEIVFKDGIGYNAAKLIESVRGRFGQY